MVVSDHTVRGILVLRRKSCYTHKTRTVLLSNMSDTLTTVFGPGNGSLMTMNVFTVRRYAFFAVRVIPAWNKPPPHIVAVDKVKTFVLALNSLSTEFFRVRQYCSIVSLVNFSVYSFLIVYFFSF